MGRLRDGGRARRRTEGDDLLVDPSGSARHVLPAHPARVDQLERRVVRVKAREVISLQMTGRKIPQMRQHEPGRDARPYHSMASRRPTARTARQSLMKPDRSVDRTRNLGDVTFLCMRV